MNRRITTEYFSLHGIDPEDFAVAMSGAVHELNKILHHFKMEVGYRNIRDVIKNPDGRKGFLQLNFGSSFLTCNDYEPVVLAGDLSEWTDVALALKPHLRPPVPMNPAVLPTENP